MISIRCPHCNVGLKVDEGKLPPGILSFKCPKCKKPIPISLLREKKTVADTSADTTLLQPSRSGMGQITVMADENTQEQVFPLYEGVSVIGRKSSASTATIGIATEDRSMSREHIRIEVKKDIKGGYKHYLSDNNSKNHTLYNSSFLENGEVIVLQDNDEIIIGRTVLRFND
ncbi:zinc-ribbon domain-containing protein [Parabacteroides sp. OttesenSCG-928-K15]|nr:zinc-ribbon domain-containing protein [Parabacteroides sp. OttesenSCG-928-K15]